MKRISSAFVLGAVFWSSPEAEAETLVLATVDRNVREQVIHLDPLATYLETELSWVGITSVKISIFPDINSATSAMWHGDADLFLDCALVATQVARDSGATPFLKHITNGQDKFRSVIVASRSSDIQDLSDLIDHRVGFDQRDSTAGFLLPAGLFGDQGLPLSKLRSRKHPVPDRSVGYIFTSSTRNTMYWLVRGWIDAGALYEEEFAHLERQFPGQFRKIATTQEAPRHVMLHRRGLHPDLLSTLRNTLTNLHNSPQGALVAPNFYSNTEFATFDGSYKSTFSPLFSVLDQLADLGLI